LIHWKSGKYEAISVRYQLPYNLHGIKMSGGLLVSDWNGRHVSNISLDMAHGISKLTEELPSYT
jgi:hypothetical protein